MAVQLGNGKFVQGKQFFRTCNVLPFSCTHLALRQGKRRSCSAPQFFDCTVLLNVKPNFFTLFLIFYVLKIFLGDWTVLITAN